MPFNDDSARRLTASSVLMADGSTWGGSGGYADIPGFIASDPSMDLPFTAWIISKDDPYPAGFIEQIEAKDAFQSARQGHAFCWDMGQHDVNGIGVIDRDGSGADIPVAYGKGLFKLNLPYIATSNSSIDDNPGTGVRDGSGVYDGDYVGCVNAGFAWTVTSDTAGAFNFTIDNNFMDRAPTTQAQTTLTGTIASSGSGAVTVTDASGFLSVSGGNNVYALVNGTEIIKITSIVGNTINYSSRGQLGTQRALAFRSRDDQAARQPADRPERRPVRDDDGQSDDPPGARRPRADRLRRDAGWRGNDALHVGVGPVIRRRQTLTNRRHDQFERSYQRLPAVNGRRKRCGISRSGRIRVALQSRGVEQCVDSAIWGATALISSVQAARVWPRWNLVAV